MQEILSKKDIGERIRNLRIANGLSQSFIADILNISRSNYSQIEIGNQYPSFTTLYSVARYYSKSYDWILHGDTQVTPNKSLNEIESLINDLEMTLSSFKNSLNILEEEVSQIKNKKTRNISSL